MKYFAILYLLVFSMCKAQPSAEKQFEGRFGGSQNGVRTVADLTVTNRQLSGTLSIGGQSSRVSGTIAGPESTGTLQDDETGKTYSYKAALAGSLLQFSITFPELNNQVISLSLSREAKASSNGTAGNEQPKTSGTKERDRRLIGLWKNTEVLGGGEYSFSTEYFMELKADGALVSWTGQSAGSGYSAGSDEANASRGEWHTEGNKLFFVDPVTKNDGHTFYSISESGLLLHNGGAQKKIFQRVR